MAYLILGYVLVCMHVICLHAEQFTINIFQCELICPGNFCYRQPVWLHSLNNFKALLDSHLCIAENGTAAYIMSKK